MAQENKTEEIPCIHQRLFSLLDQVLVELKKINKNMEKVKKYTQFNTRYSKAKNSEDIERLRIKGGQFNDKQRVSNKFAAVVKHEYDSDDGAWSNYD